MFRTRNAKRQNATFDNRRVGLFHSSIQSILTTLNLVKNAGPSPSEKSFEALKELLVIQGFQLCRGFIIQEPIMYLRERI